MSTDNQRRTSQHEASPPGAPIQDASLTPEQERAVMGSAMAEAHDATFQGFAQSVVGYKIDRLHEKVYDMGFECGWRMHEKLRSLLSGMQGGSVHRDSKTGDAVSCSSGHDGTGRTSVEGGAGSTAAPGAGGEGE